jgi:hypothetical protein
MATNEPIGSAMKDFNGPRLTALRKWLAGNVGEGWSCGPELKQKTRGK